MSTIRRAYDAKIDDVAAGERSVVAVISTDAVDRYQSVIVPKGIDLAAYRRNPVVLLEHGLGATPEEKLPIGRNLWIKSSGDGRRLIAKTQFAPPDVSPLADRVFRLFQEEFLRSFSIGGNQIEWGAPTRAEIARNPDWARAKVVYRKIELTEYSVVGVPGNAEALAMAVSRGLALPGWPAAGEAPESTAVDSEGDTETPAEPELPPLVGRTFRQAHAELIAAIRSGRPDAAAIVRDRLDLLRGRV